MKLCPMNKDFILFCCQDPNHAITQEMVEMKHAATRIYWNLRLFMKWNGNCE